MHRYNHRLFVLLSKHFLHANYQKRETPIEKSQFFEEYTIGDSCRTFGRTIIETDIVVHAGHSSDFFPHHMDAAFCRDQPFGKRIVHGTMTFAIGIGLTATQINPHAMTYGDERLHFQTPVFAGYIIRTAMIIRRKADDPKRPNHGQVVEICETINKNDKIVMYC